MIIGQPAAIVSCTVAPPAFPMSKWLAPSMRGSSSVQPMISHPASKFRTHRKSERVDDLWRDSTGAQYPGARLVWNEEVIGNATIPDGIHRDRVGDDDHVFAASARP